MIPSTGKLFLRNALHVTHQHEGKICTSPFYNMSVFEISNLIFTDIMWETGVGVVGTV